MITTLYSIGISRMRFGRIICGIVFLSSCGSRVGTTCTNKNVPCDVASQRAAEKKAGATGEVDVIAPTFSSRTSLSDISSTSALLSWDRASDTSTTQADLEYKVVYTSDEIPIDVSILGGDTLPAGVVVSQNWSKNLTSATIADLAPDTSYQVAVLVRDSNANMAMLSPKILTTNSVLSPTTGAVIAFTSITSTTAVLRWGAGSDSITTNTALLEYKLVRAVGAASIDTVAKADAITGQDLLLDWTPNTVTYNVSALIPSATYSFAVLVKNELGNKSLYAPSTMLTLATDVVATPTPTATPVVSLSDITSWTNTLGSTTVSAAIASGNYDGKSCLLTDNDLIAANILSGVNIFGVAGNLTSAYNSCTDNVSNAGQCSTAAGRYVSATAGGNITVSGSTSATITTGFYNGTQSCNVSDANLLAANIKSGVSILGVSGTSVVLASNMYRNIATTQITQEAEVAAAGTDYANADPGYRAIPKISKDDDGSIGGSVTLVNRAGFLNCGETGLTTIELRIADCATINGVDATWDGATKGNAGQGLWKLVARTGASLEVWRDERTKLLWSSKVAADSTLNWCKASGSNNIANNPAAENDPSNYCNNATYQTTGTGPGNKAVSACFEDGDNYFTTTDANINNAGKAGLIRSSTPRVDWRLPTRSDYMQAEIDGIRFVFPDMLSTGGCEWTSSIYTNERIYGWQFCSVYGNISRDDRTLLYGVRCVGR